MEKDELKNLLEQAERNISRLQLTSASEMDQIVRHRANRRRVVRSTLTFATVAVLLFSLSLWFSNTQNRKQNTQSHKQIASLEDQIQQLQTQTETTLKLVKEVLNQQRKRDRLTALDNELASINSRLLEIEAKTDQTAYRLFLTASQMYNDLNQKDSAIETYNRLINLFPNNRWTLEATKRLEEIKKQNSEEINTKGELL
ncbi:MAG: tol-pal system YbgF family protein [Phycisphaerae bacterium]